METHVTSIRVFKTNRISSPTQQEEGLFLFQLTNKFATVISHDGHIEETKLTEKIKKKSLNFNLHYLHSREHIQRLSELAVHTSALFVPVSKQILSNEIFEFLNTFQFDVNDDPSLRTQRICILVQVHSVWIIEYTRNYYYKALNEPTSDIEADDDEEKLDHETLMGFRDGLIQEARLQSARVEIGEELDGFSEISAVKVLESDEEQICCPICLEGVLMGMEVVEAPNCSHLFHMSCLIKWLHKANSCPMCRGNCTVII